MINFKNKYIQRKFIRDFWSCITCSLIFLVIFMLQGCANQKPLTRADFPDEESYLVAKAQSDARKAAQAQFDRERRERFLAGMAYGLQSYGQQMQQNAYQQQQYQAPKTTYTRCYNMAGEVHCTTR